MIEINFRTYIKIFYLYYMDVIPNIKEIAEKKLIGICKYMSLSNNLTNELWKDFILRKKEIKNIHTDELISMQLYPVSFDFNPTIKFKKWAVVEVSQIENIPKDMESLILSGGLYAIFHYKGFSEDDTIFRYIFTKWLPHSEYNVDNTRPHFEVLGKKYKNNDPDSEEDIYIPIKTKKI